MAAEYRYDGAEYGYEEGYEAEYGYGEDYGYGAACGEDYGYGAAYGEDYGYGAAYGEEYVHEEGFEAAQNVLEEEFEDVQRRVQSPVQRQRPIQIEEELPESLRIPPSDIRIGKRIGRGGFSTVHKAFWRGQACAAKVVQTTDVRAIQREVAILSKLDHPHVIRCIGFSVDSTGDPSRCMILMELMEEDLRDVMNRRLAKKLWRFRSRLVPFSEAEAVNILGQIATGMKYLHSHKVFHGDLKASNILVSHGPDGGMHVKITDFGVSQMVKRDPTENTEEFVRTKYFRGLVGTRGYQAPEVSSSSYSQGFMGTLGYMFPEHLLHPSRKPSLEGGDFYTAKADTYCFAMTCYEILSGRVPFEDVMKPADIPELVLQGVRPKLPETVDQRLKELIEQCWHEKASRRPGFEDIRSSLVDFSARSNVERKHSRAWPTFCLW